MYSFLSILKSFSKAPQLCALDYPYPRPKASYVLSASKIETEWEDFDIIKGPLYGDGTQSFHLAFYIEGVPVMFRDRVPYLCHGALGAPSYLRGLLGRSLSEGLPLLRAHIPGLSPVYSAFIDQQGFVPSSYTIDAHCSSQDHLMYVTHEQKKIIDEAMLTSENYNLIRLSMTNGEVSGFPLPSFLLFRAKKGVYAPDGFALGVDALTDQGQHMPMSQRSLLQSLCKQLGRHKGNLEDFCKDVLKDDEFRHDICAMMAMRARSDQLDFFIDHFYAE